MQHRLLSTALPCLVAVTMLAVDSRPCRAIEMFTFFGDGSRVGLPSLEVPIEAYPGIPLRSDRIRARRRAQRGFAPPAAQPGLPAGITIRQMPTGPQPVPRGVEAGRQSEAPRGQTSRGQNPRGQAATQTSAPRRASGQPPVAPSPPETLDPELVEPPIAEPR